MMRQVLCTLAGIPACLALCTATAADAGQPQEPVKLLDLPKLTVRGEAELHKPADQLRLRVGVVTEDAEATAALSRNSQRMQDVVSALEKTGLTNEEYETGRFSILEQLVNKMRSDVTYPG